MPFALHRLSDARRPNPAYSLAFGLPDARLLDVAGSYAPVRMRGRLSFRHAAPRITLAWGALCPDTPAGQALLQQILAAMAPHSLLPEAERLQAVPRLAA